MNNKAWMIIFGLVAVIAVLGMVISYQTGAEKQNKVKDLTPVVTNTPEETIMETVTPQPTVEVTLAPTIEPTATTAPTTTQTPAPTAKPTFSIINPRLKVSLVPIITNTPTPLPKVTLGVELNKLPLIKINP
ncbi:MAG: hypothetical protein WCT01_03780 [Candidatus Shapirobacteria bacterium]|jgi:hypothetical protein